ncbi:hypothetical protein M513_12816 [Trichuris suis]|uniref:Uncharacterized protein n=1 Tax=Trichuris suis TaxID=68888 RepID=A0A085LMW2_9BILA|nr:hypothetical protein M513_12816 [Trichuris suis]
MSKQMSKIAKVAERPMPAEQCTTIGGPFGCPPQFGNIRLTMEALASLIIAHIVAREGALHQQIAMKDRDITRFHLQKCDSIVSYWFGFEDLLVLQHFETIPYYRGTGRNLINVCISKCPSVQTSEYRLYSESSRNNFRVNGPLNGVKKERNCITCSIRPESIKKQ